VPEQPAKPALHWASLIGLGGELVGFAGLGVLIDYLCGTFPQPAYATVACTLLGLVAVLWQLVRFSARAG
jgi:F0F1-type ATP synthase assembly protein I